MAPPAVPPAELARGGRAVHAMPGWWLVPTGETTPVRIQARTAGGPGLIRLQLADGRVHLVRPDQRLQLIPEVWAHMTRRPGSSFVAGFEPAPVRKPATAAAGITAKVADGRRR
jgi:hypothetical protein